MTRQPSKEKVARLRARRQADGLVRLELWVKAELVERIKAYAKRLSSGSTAQRKGE